MTGNRVRGYLGDHLPLKVVTVLLVLVLVSPPPSQAWIFPFDPMEEAYIKEAETWAHPEGGGADLRFNFSFDHSMVLLIGFGAPGEVRVVDRNMSTLAVLEPPHEGFMVKGASWGEGDVSIAVWGGAPSDENDTIALYDVPSFQQNLTPPWIDLVDLPQIDHVGFHATNVIMSVAGRDPDGISRLLFIEVNSVRVHRNIEHPGNHTIITVGNYGEMLIIPDSGGNIDLMTGGDWSVAERMEGVLEGGATAWYIPYKGPWGMGDAQGRVVVQEGSYSHDGAEITIGPGPVQGLAWTLDRRGDFIAAIPRPEGGSRLVAWQFADELNTNGFAGPICHLNTTRTVTMIEPEPGGRGRVLIAFDDGTLGAFRLVIRPRPIEIRPGDPDETDGNGIEPFRKWRHESAEGYYPEFTFNNQGTLILLRGYASPEDIRVVNRTMDTLAVLDSPFWKASNYGQEWTADDRYLVTFGQGKDEDGTSFIVYDMPSFERTKELDLGWVSKQVRFVMAIEFISGDDILAVAGSKSGEDAIYVLDLEKKKVLAQHPIPDDVQIEDIHRDGEDIMVISRDGVATILSPPDWQVTRTDISLGSPINSIDVQGDNGWLTIVDFQNLTILKGEPRAPIIQVLEHPEIMRSAAWTLTDGDLVFAVERPNGGSTIQLWQTLDHPGMEGVQVISQLNSTKTCIQLAGDPAHPGLFAAGFSDGTFGLYSLNLTRYPPPPEELAGADIGPIDGTPNQGNGGIEPQTLADFAYLISIVVIIALLVVFLIWLKRSEDEDED